MENALREPWNNNSEGGHGEPKTPKSQSSGQPSTGSSINPVSLNYNSPIWFSDEIEYWPDPTKSLKFSVITSMHSELVAIGVNGQVYQWKWIDIEPYKNPEVINH